MSTSERAISLPLSHVEGSKVPSTLPKLAAEIAHRVYKTSKLAVDWLKDGFTLISDKGPKPPPPPPPSTKTRLWPGGDSVRPRGDIFITGEDKPLISRGSGRKGNKKGPGGSWGIDRSGH